VGATDRLPVLLSPEQKQRIAQRAKKANLTIGEFLRRAAEAYRPDEEEPGLDRLIDLAKKSAMQASQAIDVALAAVAASERRIERMEARAKSKQRGRR
jgi:hypothetical protein